MVTLRFLREQDPPSHVEELDVDAIEEERFVGLQTDLPEWTPDPDDLQY